MDFQKALNIYYKDIESVAEYFCVIGPSEADIQAYKESGAELTPRMLARFPPFDRQKFNLPESIETVTST